MAMKGNVHISIWASFIFFPFRRTLPKKLVECPDWDSWSLDLVRRDNYYTTTTWVRVPVGAFNKFFRKSTSKGKKDKRCPYNY